MNSPSKALMTRILVGIFRLISHTITSTHFIKANYSASKFPDDGVDEVIVLVPVTQLISFPLAGWLITLAKKF